MLLIVFGVQHDLHGIEAFRAAQEAVAPHPDMIYLEMRDKAPGTFWAGEDLLRHSNPFVNNLASVAPIVQSIDGIKFICSETHERYMQCSQALNDAFWLMVNGVAIAREDIEGAFDSYRVINNLREETMAEQLVNRQQTESGLVVVGASHIGMATTLAESSDEDVYFVNALGCHLQPFVEFSSGLLDPGNEDADPRLYLAAAFVIRCERELVGKNTVATTERIQGLLDAIVAFKKKYPARVLSVGLLNEYAIA